MSIKDKQEKIVFIVGPTAVGKSEVAFCLAKEIHGEIISCDSMQVYKEIAVANDKPGEKFLDEVPHHLLDVASLSRDYDVIQFNKRAVRAVKKVLKSKHIPVICGGSGLYMSSLLDGIFDAGKPNPKLRERLRKLAEKNGNEYLHKKLQKVDPESAGRIHANDLKRVIRALEVFEGEGAPLSKLNKKRSGLWGKYDVKVIGLNRKRDRLYERINSRVDRMFKRGLVGEIKSLESIKLSRTAKSIIGIKELHSYFQGEISLEEAKQKIKLNTRHFAKRQLTWFRHEKRIQWINVQDGLSTHDVVSQIMKILGNQT